MVMSRQEEGRAPATGMRKEWLCVVVVHSAARCGEEYGMFADEEQRGGSEEVRAEVSKTLRVSSRVLPSA